MKEQIIHDWAGYQRQAKQHTREALGSVQRFNDDTEGGTLIEYAFLASMIGLAAAGTMSNLGQTLAEKLGMIARTLM